MPSGITVKLVVFLHPLKKNRQNPQKLRQGDWSDDDHIHIISITVCPISAGTSQRSDRHDSDDVCRERSLMHSLSTCGMGTSQWCICIGLVNSTLRHAHLSNSSTVGPIYDFMRIVDLPQTTLCMCDGVK